MTALGKPLVFHLKHMAEMNRLYGDAEYDGIEPDLMGLERGTCPGGGKNSRCGSIRASCGFPPAMWESHRGPLYRARDNKPFR